MASANLSVSWEEEGVQVAVEGFQSLQEAQAHASLKSAEHMYAYVNGTDEKGETVSQTFRFSKAIEEEA